MIRFINIITAMLLFLSPFAAYSAEYKIDTQGMHASINFKIKHLGYSWLTGQFKQFNGHFNYDKNNPELSNVEVQINTASVDTNHTERDKHLRSADFLNANKYKMATFKSTSYKKINETKGILMGNLTLNNVTKPVTIDVTFIGEGKDPWGGYRAGFTGKTTLDLKNFNIKQDLGKDAQQVELTFHIEGIMEQRQTTNSTK
ncbi:YceI family protein [Thiotrichales bacterium 19S3-7]|nr:YceI family protein [Thiotrichales bacterium 19S3-7]MCF6801172.1 YceI family protein [Thiotrichales bacterium 19S3-11]